MGIFCQNNPLDAADSSGGRKEEIPNQHSYRLEPTSLPRQCRLPQSRSPNRISPSLPFLLSLWMDEGRPPLGLGQFRFRGVENSYREEFPV